MITEGYCWKSLPDHQKDIYWERWKPYFRWDPSIDEAIMRAAYDAKTCIRYGALMHELRALGVRPDFVTNEAWNRYRPSKHTSGTRSFRTYEDILALDRDEDDEVTLNDIFLHVHTKDHDGVTFIDSRSARFHLIRRHEEHTQATSDQPIDEKQLYYDATGECSKGRVYGLRSLAKRNRIYEDPGARTSREPMVRGSELDAVVRGLRSSRVSCRASWECAWTSEQAPFRHHHRRHHLRSIISRLGWTRLVHHSSNMTMMMGTSRIGWMRSTLVTKVSTPKESLKGVQGVGKGHLQLLLFRRTMLE
ncbi:hypothetical protein Scep_029809 [Stephania cephalantha]|uniref:Transposase n=1 Tax=Stephania cephalantha TaxID=152367 RepID=A0AAP0HCM8_9MAGN